MILNNMMLIDGLLQLDILLFILSIIYLICIKKEKVVLLLPLTINLFFITYYNFIDDIIMEIRARLCPFGGEYNFDYTRPIICSIMILFMLILSIYLSKKIESKKAKIIYIITIFLFNIILAYITYIFHRVIWIS